MKICTWTNFYILITIGIGVLLSVIHLFFAAAPIFVVIILFDLLLFGNLILKSILSLMKFNNRNSFIFHFIWSNSIFAIFLLNHQFILSLPHKNEKCRTRSMLCGQLCWCTSCRLQLNKLEIKNNKNKHEQASKKKQTTKMYELT